MFSNVTTIRNSEVFLFDETAATVLLQPMTASEPPLFNSLDGVDALGQYEHLS
ncbi:hypothetical protein OAI58_09610 [Amylibacter sp.]|nr:hypothetical protein [Amylibacter sp.]